MTFTILEVLVVLTVHFVFDWLCQTRWQAENKSSNFEALLEHIMIQVAGYFFILLFIPSPIGMLVFVLINMLVHMFQDKYIWSLYKHKVTKGKSESEIKNFVEKNLYAKDYWFYSTVAVDQFLHLALLFITLGYAKGL